MTDSERLHGWYHVTSEAPVPAPHGLSMSLFPLSGSAGLTGDRTVLSRFGPCQGRDWSHGHSEASEHSDLQQTLRHPVPPCPPAPIRAALRPRRREPSRLLAARAGSSHTLCRGPGRGCVVPAPGRGESHGEACPRSQGQSLSQTTQVSRVSYQPHVPSAGVGQRGAWRTGTKPASGPSARAGSKPHGRAGRATPISASTVSSPHNTCWQLTRSNPTPITGRRTHVCGPNTEPPRRKGAKRRGRRLST